MNQTPETKDDDRVERSTVVLIVCATIIITVVALHFAGALNHTGDQDGRIIGEFTAIYLDDGQQHRLSHRDSELHAQCLNGWLAVAPNATPVMRGLLVDYRNRGIRCGSPAAPVAPDGEAP